MISTIKLICSENFAVDLNILKLKDASYFFESLNKKLFNQI